MENIKRLEAWLLGLSPMGVIVVSLAVLVFLLPEILIIQAYFSKTRWPWLRTMIENKDNKPDHADGNFIMLLYGALWILRGALTGVAVMFFTDKSLEILIGELLTIYLLSLGIKYVSPLLKKSPVVETINEKFEEKIKTITKSTTDDKAKKTKGPEA